VLFALLGVYYLIYLRLDWMHLRLLHLPNRQPGPVLVRIDPHFLPSTGWSQTTLTYIVVIPILRNQTTRLELTAFARSSAAAKALSLSLPASLTPPPSAVAGVAVVFVRVEPAAVLLLLSLLVLFEGAGPDPRTWPLPLPFGLEPPDGSEKQFPMSSLPL
jgi:hypothetical protein